MTRKSRRQVLPVAVAVLLGLAQAAIPRAQDADPNEPQTPPTTTLLVEVLDEESRGPIRRAEVFVKSEAEGVDFEKTSSTNTKGLVTFLKVPRGAIKLQVTAEGRQTFGVKRALTQSEEKITAGLKKLKPEEPSSRDVPSR